MPTLIHNTTIITADDLDRVYLDATIAIDGAQITAIGSTSELLREVGRGVDGQWRMRDGCCVTLDEDAIVREADCIARAAWRRLFEAHPELSPPSGMHIRESV
jgi:hypothetical protein